MTLEERVAALEHRVMQLESVTTPLRPFGPIPTPTQNGACMICGEYHGIGNLPCPKMTLMCETR